GAGFFVNASGVGSLTYQWQLKTPQASTFSDIPAATFASLQVNPTANDNGNEYRVIITDDNNTPSDMLDDCQVTSNLAILWVSCSGATITRQPQDATIIAGESVTFSVEASGVGNLGYLWQWKSPTEAEFPLTSFVAPATITLLPPDSLNGFQYRAIVTDDNNTPNEFSDDCLVFSDAATLTINEDLPELFWNNALIDENGFLIRNLIRGAKLDGSGIDSLTTSFSPFDIKVDTAGGKMYWVNTNVPDGVFSANLDGSNTVNLIQGNSDLTSPFSLELDLLNGKIYVYAFFYQQEFSSLISMNLDGSNIQLVRRGLPFLPFRSGFKLDLLANKLYAPGTGAFYDSYDWDPQTDTITNPVPIPISLPNDISQGGPFDIDLENCQIYFAATNRVNGTGNAFIQIYHANLDGSGVPELLHSLTPTDNIIQDLSLDLTNQHLYFSLGYNNLNIGGTNLIGQGIDRIDLDGSNRTEIISLPDQLTLFEGYFTQINAPVANTDKITRIKVAKLTSEEGNPSYGFTGANGLGAFTVEGNSYKAFPNLAPGTYTIMEDALAAGIILEGITIEGDLDDGSVIDLANRTITVDLDQDEDITVTFNNVEQPLFLNLTSFTLVDAETNTEIREIKDGDKLLLENVPSSFTIIAKVEGTRTTDRVFIDLNGPVNNERTERRAPYAVFGDSRGNYSGRPPVAGIYGITATPFYDEGGLQAGTSLTINFEIIDCASGGPSVSAGPANRLDCSSGEAILMGRVTGGTGMTTTSWSGPNGYSSSDLMPTVNLAGTYTLTVTDSLGCTDSGEVLIAPCLASCDPQVVRFTLVDAKSDTEIRELVDNAVIDLGQDGRDLGIIAEVSCESEVRSVKLELLGTQVRTRTENKAPFSLTGDINGDYRDQEFIPGTYTLKATPFTERNAQGSAGIELMINFTVINGTPAQQTQFGDPSLNPGYELSVYPVPTDQELIIDMKFFEQGVYEAELFDVAGRTILSQTLIYEEGIGKRFSLDTQSLVVGVYMLRIAGQRYQEWKKVSIRR
ncbi:MAG: T9SS type A sorting domain-containing protein, partial [Bacteroidota bacterium]